MELNMYQEKIFNIQTNEETFRDYTKEEIAEVEAKKAEIEAINAENQKKRQEIANAKAELLAKLGITEDEAKLLLS